MKTTITVRLDARQANAVTQAARRTGRSVSDVVRDALDSALTERTIAARAGHVRGRLRLPRRARSRWRETIRERNWRS
ncbi:MAG TPA: ribbon-helix-helix protein, CopG family [Vicinamibacterales bacterium]|nr:ribbon-helix-helix protein, CopG family [Vicinamibacterales bacterium]